MPHPRTIIHLPHNVTDCHAPLRISLQRLRNRIRNFTPLAGKPGADRLSLLRFDAVQEENVELRPDGLRRFFRALLRIGRLRHPGGIALRGRHVRIELIRRAVRRLSPFLPFLFAALPLLGGCLPGDSAKSVSVLEMREARARGSRALLLDVRNPEELEGELGALDGALNIPLQDLERGLSLLDEHRRDSIFVICRGGTRSMRGAAYLVKKGFTAFNVSGGMKEWRDRFGAANR